MDSHLYRNVHDKNPFKKNMDSTLYRNEHGKNPVKNNMDSHSYRNVHDENPYTKKWTVLRTEMSMTKTHIQRNG